MNKVLQYIRFAAITTYIFFILSWVAPLCSVLTLQPARAHEFWSRVCTYSLRIKNYFLPDSKQLQRDKRTMYLLNHRTQGDFFIHDLITDFSANYLARWMVGIVFPFLALATILFTKSVWFFVRGNVDLQKFFEWIDYRFTFAKRKNILVYPEGHRMNRKNTPGRIKTGMLQYAFQRKVDIQIVMTFGIEDIYNEKELNASWGPNDLTSYVDEPIVTANFKDWESFYQFVVDRFTQVFEMTYNEHQNRKKKKTQ